MGKGSAGRLVVFEGCCREWMRMFGLTDWTASFEEMDDGLNRAEVSYNHCSRQAVFRLLKKRVPSRELRLSALHEVLHVLFADLTGMAEEIKNGEVVVREEHRIIARIENYILSTVSK